MDILKEMERRRDSLNDAIAALKGHEKRRGRKRGHKLSDAARRKISIAAKRRWRAFHAAKAA